MLIMGAVAPYLFTSTLPNSIAWASLLLTVICALGLAPGLRVYCVLPLFFLITTLAVNQRILQRLPLSESKQKLEITGVIGSLPVSRGDALRFLFLPDEPVAPIPSRIYVNWYKERSTGTASESHLPDIRAGERWRLQLVLRSPRGRVNFHGVDTERWHFVQGIGATAYVQRGENSRLAGPDWFDLNHWRERVLGRLNEKAGTSHAFRVLVALAIADRRGLSAHDRDILSVMLFECLWHWRLLTGVV